MSTDAGADRGQLEMRNFMSLLPLTLEIAGLPKAEAGRHFNEGQLDVRATTIRNAYKVAKKLLREALSKAKSLDKEDEDVEPKTLQSGVNGIFKGKGKAVEDDDEDDGIQEFVVCTLDSKQHYQQPLDFTIQADEDCFFRVVGGHTVHLTGNYVLDGLPDSDSEEEEDSEDEEMEYDTLDNMLLNA